MESLKYIKSKIKERKNLFKGSPKYWLIQLKMFKALIKNDVLEQPHIFRIELMNTMRCNALCSHCSNHRMNEDHLDIKKNTINRVKKEVKKNGTPSIVFLGGESLVDKNIFEYLESFVNLNMAVGLTSNCIKLGRETIERLKKIGISGLGTTIYDSRAEIHDEVLQIPGLFEKLNKAMEICDELNFPFSLCTVYTKEIAANGAMERMIEFAKSKNRSLKVNLLMPVGRSASEDQMLTKKEIEKVNSLALNESGISTHCIFNGEKERCPMGRTYVGITPAGDMIPCYFMPISLGNINEMSFKEYLDYAQSFPIFTKKGLPKGYCLVAESKKFFKEILEPIYQMDTKVPYEIWKDKDFEKRLREFEFN